MSQNSASLSRIEELRAQIAQLEKEGIQELRAKRATLADEIASIDAQLIELTGGVPAKGSGRAKAAPGRSIPLSDLKVLLAAAPEKTVNIRKEGLDLANIKTLRTCSSLVGKARGQL